MERIEKNRIDAGSKRTRKRKFVVTKKRTKTSIGITMRSAGQTNSLLASGRTEKTATSVAVWRLLIYTAACIRAAGKKIDKLLKIM